MTVVICEKRLGRLSAEMASQELIEGLQERNIDLELATRQELWAEAYKEVGPGVEWCQKNQ